MVIGAAHRSLRMPVAAVLAAATLLLTGTRPLTTRPSEAVLELLAGSVNNSVHVDDGGPAQAEGGGLRLARTRRTATFGTRTPAPFDAAPGRRRPRRRDAVRTMTARSCQSFMYGWRVALRWERRLLTLVVLVAGMILVPSIAQAEPTPSPPAPSAPAQAPGDAACGGGELPAEQQRWCFGWADYAASPPKNNVSHWITNCTKTKSPDELAACQTVSFEFGANPKDGTRAVLTDVPVGVAPVKDMVGCKTFGLAAAGAIDGTQHGLQESKIWAAKGSRCDAIADALLPALGAKVAPAPPKVEKACDTLDQQCKLDKAVEGAVERGVDAGIQGVVNLVVQGVAKLLSMLASLVFTETSIAEPTEAFYLVYNSTAGILLVFVFVLFIVSAIINTLRLNGRGPLASVAGLVRAVLGITFAGGIAWLLVSAWDEATNALLKKNAGTSWDASLWITALTNLSAGAGTAALALVGGGLALVGLFFVFIIMLFRGVLTTGAALFGAAAMAGQVSEETRSWGRRWFWTVNALAASKFWIAALWIYGGRAAYGSDDLTTVLQAVLIIWLMVFAPGILLRLTAVWDGYLADINGRAFAATAVAGVGDFLGRAADGLTDRVNGGGGNASGLMSDNVADMDDVVDGGPAGELAGDLADDVDTNESGERVGDVSAIEETSAGEDLNDAGSPNADEAEAVGDNADGARADVATAADNASAATGVGSGSEQEGHNGDENGDQHRNPEEDNQRGISVPDDPTGEDDTGGNTSVDHSGAGADESGQPDPDASPGGSSNAVSVPAPSSDGPAPGAQGGATGASNAGGDSAGGETGGGETSGGATSGGEAGGAGGEPAGGAAGAAGGSTGGAGAAAAAAV